MCTPMLKKRIPILGRWMHTPTPGRGMITPGQRTPTSGRNIHMPGKGDSHTREENMHADAWEEDNNAGAEEEDNHTKTEDVHAKEQDTYVHFGE